MRACCSLALGLLMACGGPKLSPPVLTPAALRDWADGEGEGQLVQLPVQVRWSVLGVEAARVLTAEPDQGLPLRLDEGALGLPLVSRLRERCGDDTSTCEVWLEGRFGRLVSGMPMTLGVDERTGARTFAVTQVLGPVEDRPGRARIP